MLIASSGNQYDRIKIERARAPPAREPRNEATWVEGVS